MEIRITENISDADYSSIVDACARYEELATRTAYSVMNRNYYRLLDLRDLFTNLDGFNGAFRDVNQRHLTVTFMNELLNWLVSTRFYLETNRNFITVEYGKDNRQLQDHVHATNEAYDRFRGYRFMYKLRDFAQHGGVPLSGLNIQPSSSGDMELVPYLTRQDLLASSFKWGGPVRQIITGSDDVIPILPLVDEAMQGLELIERVAFAMHLDRVKEVLPALTDARTRVGDTDGHPACFSLPDSSGQMTWKTLPTSESLSSARDAANLPELPARLPRQWPGAQHLTTRQRGAARRASAAIGALLLPDDTEHERIVHSILASDDSAIPLVSGLSDMARVLLIVASQALGTSSEAMLGALTPEDGDI